MVAEFCLLYAWVFPLTGVSYFRVRAYHRGLTL